MLQHQHLHDEREEFTCQYCDSVYHTRAVLNIHYVGKHGPGYPCANCDAIFDIPMQRNRHQKCCIWKKWYLPLIDFFLHFLWYKYCFWSIDVCYFCASWNTLKIVLLLLILFFLVSLWYECMLVFAVCVACLCLNLWDGILSPLLYCIYAVCIAFVNIVWWCHIHLVVLFLKLYFY